MSDSFKVDWEKFDQMFTSSCEKCHGRDFQLKVEIDMIPLSLPTGMRIACSSCGHAYAIVVSRFDGDEPPVKNPIVGPIRVWRGEDAPKEYREHIEDTPLWLAHIPAQLRKKDFYFPGWLERIDSVSEPKKKELPDGSLLVFGYK